LKSEIKNQKSEMNAIEFGPQYLDNGRVFSISDF